MAMFDAFSGFLRESAAGAIEDAITRLVERGMIQQPPRALQYARTVNDAMRVNVENQQTVSVYKENSSSVVYTAPFAQSATFQVDEREQQRLATENNFNTMRTGRWTFS